jgi:hypothetical protein
MDIGCRRILAAAPTASAAAAPLGVASPARAAIHISGDWTNRTTVTGVAPCTWPKMRTGPGYRGPAFRENSEAWGSAVPGATLVPSEASVPPAGRGW